MDSNILFFARVDRTTLIIEMKNYIKNNSLSCNIVVLSDNKYSPNQHFADKFILLPCNIKSTTDFLKDIIIKNEIRGVFVASSFDVEFILQIESWLLENHVIYFAPNRDTLKICLAKSEMFAFLSKNNLPTPLVYQCSFAFDNIESANMDFPLVLKPNAGQGSYCVHIVHDRNEFQFFYNRIENPVVQQYISGKHYTVDCFNDLMGRLKVCVARLRVLVEGANYSVCEFVNNKFIQELAYDLSSSLNIIGTWNFQVIESNDAYFIHDINPRIASGVIYSIIAGVHFEKYIVDSLLGIDNKNWGYTINYGNVISQYKNFVIVK